MALPLALPLAPVVAPGATTAATFIVGSSLALAETVLGFRRDVPTLPPITGTEGLATLREMIADAWAGARVPVASPLPPPFNPGGLGLLSAAAAGVWQVGSELSSQVWGLINGPERTEEIIEVELPFPGGLNPSDPFQGTTGWRTPKPGQHLNIYKLLNDGSELLWWSVSSIAALSIGKKIPSDPTRRFNNYNFINISGDNVVCNAGVCAEDYGVEGYRVGTSDGLPGLEAMPLGADPLPAFAEVPWSNPYMWPESAASAPMVPSALTLPALPAYLPAYLPGASPINQPTPTTTEPASQPLSPWPLPASTTTTTRQISGPTTATIGSAGAALPALPAYTPPLTRPAPAEPVTQTQTDGALVPTTAPPVVATDPGAVVPWPGAAAIPGTGLAPAPTLQGIAQEVGRIERKLEIMMNPESPGNLLDKFADLKDLIGPLLEAIVSLSSSTTYQLDSPCEVDQQGNKLPPVQVQVPGALNAFGVLQNRIDGIAELLQVHKDLKQPNCKPKQPTGEFVTVNFEEID